MIVMLRAHPSRAGDLLVADDLRTTPGVPTREYRDGFGNICTRLEAPAGRIKMTTEGLIADSGLPEPVSSHAEEHAVGSLPEDTLVYLLGSRYCETDVLMNDA